MGVADSSVLGCRIFQFENGDWYTIDEKYNIGNTGLVALMHLELVDYAEYIVVPMLEVYVIEVESIGATVGIGEVEAVTVEFNCVESSLVIS